MGISISTAAYSLLDAGAGRRLERFGTCVVDRPAPSVEGVPPHDSAAWDAADARFGRSPDSAGWTIRHPLPAPWLIRIDRVVLELRLAASGQVGLFPEHVDAANWIVGQLAGRHGDALNLFAYTGYATLLLATAGNRVVHVDAARGAVLWARRNAELSSLTAAPIRWIVDDAEAFVRREVRRGRRYDAIVLDPPSYGHAPDGTAWRLEERLGSLLDGCSRLLAPRGCCLLTAHTAALDGEHLVALLGRAMTGSVTHGSIEIRAETGARLPLGAFARLSRA